MDLNWNFNDFQMQKSELRVFSVISVLPNIGGFWQVIRVLFGAFIFLILHQSFWKDFAKMIIQKK